MVSDDNYKNIGLHYRRARFHLFREFVQARPAVREILDVGGTQKFWDQMGYPESDAIRVTILNLDNVEITRRGFRFVQGDARDLSAFGDHSFDVVFSNSVIEHVGGYRDQIRMADHIRRVGRSWYVQTPCRTFPFEPHHQRFFLHYLPKDWQVRLLQYNIVRRGPHTYRAARLAVEGITLLSAAMLRDLFPGGRLIRERALGLTKSWIIHSP